MDEPDDMLLSRRTTFRHSPTRRAVLGLGLAALLGGLAACSSVEVRSKPGSGLTRDSSFTLDVQDDVTATRAKLTSRLIARGFNVIVALPGSTADQSDAQRSVLPSRLRRVANALPSDAPVDDGFAARFVLVVDHEFSQKKRLGITTTRYTQFAARMVDRVTGQVVLSAVLDGGRKVDATLDDLVDALDEGLI